MSFIVSERYLKYNEAVITCAFEDGNKALLRHVVVDCIVRDGDKILLAKRAPHLSNGGKFGLIGGFVNRDETVAQAALREIYEETGYEGTVTTLLRIIDNPHRRGEDRQNISFVFIVDAGERTGSPDAESTEVQWHSLNSLPSEELFAFDHFETIQIYKKYVTQTFKTPLIKL